MYSFKAETVTLIICLSAVTSGCEYHVIRTGENGLIISSENYPSEYNNNADECWLILADSGVRLILNNYHMEGCCDFLQIFNGSSDASPSLRVFSGSGYEVNSINSGRQMYLRFTTDSSITHYGFQACVCDYNTESCMESCAFTDPDMENSYGNWNIQLKYIIAGALGMFLIAVCLYLIARALKNKQECDSLNHTGTVPSVSGTRNVRRYRNRIADMWRDSTSPPPSYVESIRTQAAGHAESIMNDPPPPYPGLPVRNSGHPASLLPAVGVPYDESNMMYLQPLAIRPMVCLNAQVSSRTEMNEARVD